MRFRPDYAFTMGCALLLFAIPGFSDSTVIARPDAFRTLVNPNCSHCIDEAKRRGQELRDNDRVLSWIRGKYDGGAIAMRFFLVPYRVISDTYGVFVFDADSGFARGFEPSLDFTFYGWRNGIMVIRHKDGTLYSALSGVAFDGPRKGDRLKPIPTLVTDWGYWLKAYPGTVAYHMYDKYQAIELPTEPEKDAIASRPTTDPRLHGEDIVIGLSVGGASKAFPIAELSRRGVIRDRIGEQDIVVLWYEPTKTAAIYAPRMDEEKIPEKLTLQPSKQIPTAPFMDRETFTHWTIEGRAVEGPLRGKTLQWLPAVQCRWVAWSAEYPETEVYDPTKGEIQEPKRDTIARLIHGERVDWNKLVKTYGRLISVSSQQESITVLGDTDKAEHIIPVTPHTEVFVRGAFGSLADFRPGQRVYLILTTNEKKDWETVYALSDEISMQAMSQPYILKDASRDQKLPSGIGWSVTLGSEKGNREEVRLAIDDATERNFQSRGGVHGGQVVYYNARQEGTSAIAIELMDAPAFSSARDRQFRKNLSEVRKYGLIATVLQRNAKEQQVTFLVRRADSWFARCLKVNDAVRATPTDPSRRHKTIVVNEVRPDYARTRIRARVDADALDLFPEGSEVRLHMRINGRVDMDRPPDLGRFSERQDRIDYFLSTIYCTCGMMGNS